MDMVSPDDEALSPSYNDLERLRDPSHTRCLTLSELRGVLQASGLRVKQVAARDVVVRLEPWMEMTAAAPAAREVIRQRLADELAGGTVTGMRPFQRGSEVMFTQTWATVVAER